MKFKSPFTTPMPLTPMQLKSSQEHLFIIDVRSWLEYIAGHIPQAKCLSRNRILQEVPQDQEIVITCFSGQRSIAAAQWLITQGYPRVYNLQGGLLAWKSVGYPVTTGTQP